MSVLEGHVLEPFALEGREGLGRYGREETCGTVTGMKRATPESFWARTLRVPSGCLEWQGHRNGGYGVVRYQRDLWKVHRLAWTLTHGPIPPGLAVCHRCDNPSCADPEHLFLGTWAENRRDAAAKGRLRLSTAGERNGMSKLTEADVHAIRERLAAGKSQRAIAQEFGVDQTLISFIKRRLIWAHVG